MAPVTLVTFAWAAHLTSSTATHCQGSCLPAPPPIPTLLFPLPAQWRWTRPPESLLGPDVIKWGQKEGVSQLLTKWTRQPAYIDRRKRGEGSLVESWQSPHVCTNHGTIHYANEGLCLHQSQVRGAEVPYKLLAGVVPSGAGVVLWVLAWGQSVWLAVLCSKQWEPQCSSHYQLGS
jgi:hypothetical protein